MEPFTSFQLNKFLGRIFIYLQMLHGSRRGSYSSDYSNMFEAVGKDTFRAGFWLALKQDGVCLCHAA